MSDDFTPTPPSPFGGEPKGPAGGNEAFRERKQAVLIALLGASFALGAVDAVFGPPGAGSDGNRLIVTVLGNLALLIIGFRWLNLDAQQLDIRRPSWLNVAIILVAIVFVPYYLYKTRPEGLRGKATLLFFGVVIACMVASGFGAMLSTVLFGTADPSATPTI